MKTITFKSSNDNKLDLLVDIAKKIGVEVDCVFSYDDEEADLGLPGPKISEEQLEKWLARGDGEADYTTEQVLEYIRQQRLKKNLH